MLDMIFLMIATAAGGGDGTGTASASAVAPAQEALTQAAPATPASAPATTVFSGGKDGDSAASRTSEAPPAPATSFLTPKQETQTAPATTTFLAPKQEAPAAPATTFLAPSQQAPATSFLAPSQQAPATAFLAPQTDQAASQPTFLAPPTGLVAEPQIATGRFTTALEVKPILNATRANWISVLDSNGKDLLYVTHLWAWRCGLLEIRIGLNGNPPQVWPMPQCRLDQQSPAAILEEDGLPYAEFARGALALIEVQITYDDLTTDSAKFSGNGLLVP